MMAKTLVELDFPTGSAQGRQGIAHEPQPVILTAQTKRRIRRATKRMQHLHRNLLQSGTLKAGNLGLFALAATHQTNRLAIRQYAEFTRVARLDLGVEITKHRQRHINHAFLIARRVAAPIAVPVDIQGFQSQHGKRRRFDTAQVGNGIPGRQRQTGAQFGQGISGQSRLNRRKRRQGKQACNDFRRYRHFKRTDPVIFQIDVPRHLQGNDQIRLGRRLEARTLTAIAIDSPGQAGRTRLSQRKGGEIVGRIKTFGLQHQAQGFAAVLRPQAKGPQAAVIQPISPQQTENF